MFARGCDLSEVPLASDVPEVDLKAVLGVDSANPLLRAARIEAGLLDERQLPAEVADRVPSPHEPADG
jgi:hypothetical protein